MKFLYFSLLLFSISLFSQNHRFIYDYTFAKDSLVKDSTFSENMYLDIDEKGSKYYSYGVYKKDSLFDAANIKRMSGVNVGSQKDFDAVRSNIKGIIKDVVEKRYSNNEITYYNSFGGVNYKQIDDRKLIWEIEPEIQKIGIWNAQRATTKMFGRKWNAWFSTELPFQDGPYKFYGLPGLIVKIESEDQSHIIELKGVETLPNDFKIVSAQEKDTFTKTVEVDYLKYKNAYQKYLKDPVSPLRAMMMGSVKITSMTDENGREMDINKTIRDSEESMLKINKKINNLLELDLLVGRK